MPPEEKGTYPGQVNAQGQTWSGGRWVDTALSEMPDSTEKTTAIEERKPLQSIAPSGEKPTNESITDIPPATKSSPVLDTTEKESYIPQEEQDALNAQKELADSYAEKYQTFSDNLRKDTDAELESAVASIENTFKKRIERMQQANTAVYNNKYTGGIRTKQARYMPTQFEDTLGQELESGAARINDLESEKSRLIAEAKRTVYSDAKDKWSTFYEQMEAIKKAQDEKYTTILNMSKLSRELEDRAIENSRKQLADQKTILETKKLEQEVLLENLDSFVSGFVDIGEDGNVTMASPEELQQIAEESGIPYSQLVGAMRQKAYDLSKLSQEDRQRELNIMKIQRDIQMEGMTELTKNYEYAVKNQGYTGSIFDFKKEMEQSEQTTPNSYREWQFAGSPGTYAEWLKKGLTNDMSPQQVSTFNRIVDKYQASPLVKANDRTLVLKTVSEKLKEDPTNSSLQVSFIYSLIQALDTYQSAVREGEIGLIGSTQGVLDKIQNLPEKIAGGSVLSENKVNQYLQTAEVLVNSIGEAAKQKQGQFASQANVSGVGDAWNQYVSGSEEGALAEGEAEADPAKKLDDFYVSNPEKQEYIDKLSDQYSDEEILKILGVPGFSNEGSGSVQRSSEVEKISFAIGQHESGGNYNARGKDGEIGKYQIMPGNYRSWARDAGVDPNDTSPQAQEKIAQAKISQYLQQYNGDPVAVAIAWNAGPGRANEYVRTGKIPQLRGTSAGGGAYDVPKYVQNVIKNMS